MNDPDPYSTARYCITEGFVGNSLADEAIKATRQNHGDTETLALAYIDMREATDTE